jgi:hypothetical protein
MAAQFEINNLADSDIYYTQKALVTALELALVEDLDGDDRRVLYGTLRRDQITIRLKRKFKTHTSKFSFQYGFRVFLITLVVCVCSLSTVITAKGSGSLKTSRLARPSAATTRIASVHSISIAYAVHYLLYGSFSYCTHACQSCWPHIGRRWFTINLQVGAWVVGHLGYRWGIAGNVFCSRGVELEVRRWQVGCGGAICDGDAKSDLVSAYKQAPGH